MIPQLIFRDISRQRFLADYWQRRPVVLRQAVSPEYLQLSPDELAGLACEPDIESRLICQKGDTAWSLRHGPFDQAVFATLPERDWTLLVQDVDKHLPDVGALLDAFDFVPDWRLDDIMISYAVDGGGVGPHIDHYDVFLIQAAGRRRWRLSHRPFTEDDLLEDCPLRVLKDFPVDEDWVLKPGDVLYLPPRVGHWGTALGECITWSVGMRGPSDVELMAAWAAYLAQQDRPHLGDSIKGPIDNPAEVTPQDLANTRDLMQGCVPEDDPAFRRWLGSYLTEPKPGFEIEPAEGATSAEDLARWRSQGRWLHRHPWARFALLETGPATLTLCCQGETLEVDKTLAPAMAILCRRRQLPLGELPLPPHPVLLDALLADLIDRGWLQTDA